MDEKSHHPLPADARARHDLIPESIEDARALGDDDPGAPAPSPSTPPDARRTPEPSFGADEEGDVPPAKDDSSAAWVKEGH